MSSQLTLIHPILVGFASTHLCHEIMSQRTETRIENRFVSDNNYNIVNIECPIVFFKQGMTINVRFTFNVGSLQFYCRARPMKLVTLNTMFSVLLLDYYLPTYLHIGNVGSERECNILGNMVGHYERPGT